MTDPSDFSALRARMRQQHLAGRDIVDAEVLRAMGTVPRERFVPPTEFDQAYEDRPLAIGCGQTISQPYIVALMTQMLQVRKGHRVLEIGTGSGYQTAILAEMGASIFTIERHEDLLERAMNRLEDLGYGEQITPYLDDGTLGCPEEAPFDRIVVAAAGPHVPEGLKQQLAPGGRLVLPVGRDRQRLVTVTREGEHFSQTEGIAVMFVKLIGEDGFPA